MAKVVVVVADKKSLENTRLNSWLTYSFSRLRNFVAILSLAQGNTEIVPLSRNLLQSPPSEYVRTQHLLSCYYFIQIK